MTRLPMAMAGLLALAPGTALGQSRPTGLAAACGQPGGVVDEAGLVRIGGIDQWVVVQGRDCANPVVLIVHGGPGNPNTPFAHNLFDGWARDFTLVHWDQRGAGKTYAANKPGEDDVLTMDRLSKDGIEVARYAAKRFGKRKVILMGGSWGSALAVNMALAAPDLFHAYVGTAQLANYHEDLAAGYARVLAMARAGGDADATGRLEKLGPPPWTDPRAFGVLRRISRKYEAADTEPAPKGWFSFAPGYDTPAYRADYEAGEDYSFMHFVGLAGDGMGPKIDLIRLGQRFAMPVYMLQGEKDLVTPPEVSRAYFDKISAPKKEFRLLPRTGHDPNAIMIGAQLAVLQRIRPDASKADAQ